MNQGAWDLLAGATRGMAADPESDVVFAGEYEGRWAVRMRQTVRDFTTVWFEVGDRTVGYEAYVLPGPGRNREEIYRRLLARNYRAHRCAFALDGESDIFLRGRIALAEFSRDTIDEVLGAIYEMVEVSFGSLTRLLTGREKSL